MPPVCTRLSKEVIDALDERAAAVGQERSSYVRDLVLRDLGLLKSRRPRAVAAG